MPSSLRFALLLSAVAAFAAPISIVVIHKQDVRAARLNAEQMTGGNVARGKVAIQRYGCGGCHSITGVSGADGQVGPSLSKISAQAEVAGMQPNTPDAMVRWLQHPQQIVPGNGMPDLGVSPADARDIAAYLYTLRPPAT